MESKIETHHIMFEEGKKIKDEMGVVLFAWYLTIEN